MPVDDGRPAAGPRHGVLPRADRRGDRPRRRPDRDLASGRSSSPATASCAGARRRSCGRSPAGLHVPVAATFMGKGAMDDRSHLSLMAVGLQARDHVLTGFDRADLVDLRRLRPRRVRAGPLEPRRPQADRPHRHPAGRGRRPVPARGRADRRHRRLAPAAPRRGPAARDQRPRRRGAPRGPRDPRPRRPPDRAARGAAGAPAPRRRRAADHARSGRSPTCARRSARRTSSCRDVGAHKVWVARLYQAYEPNTVIISNGFAAMGISLPGRDRGQARPPGSQGRRAVRRRRLPDEQPGARDGEADRGEHHGRRLARRRLRPDRLEAAQRVRAAVRRRVRQPGLRRLRRVVRDRRVPAGVGRRPAADAPARAGRRRAVARRGPDRLPREPPADRAPRGAAGP